MADTTTTAYGLTKPEIGASEDTWGTKINTDLDTLDTVVNAIGGKTAAATLSYADAAKIATTATGVTVTGEMAATTIDLSSNAVIDGTALVTGVLTTTAATVFNGGFASNSDSTMGTNKKLIFRDSDIHISSVNDGDLMIAANDEIDITSTLIDINGAVDMSSTLTVSGLTYVNSSNSSGVALTVGGEGGSGLKQQFILASGQYNWQIGAATHVTNTFSIVPSTASEGTSFANPAINISQNGNIVFNENSLDSDFRVESDTNANAFFVDGSSGDVGIGTGSPVTFGANTSGITIDGTAAGQHITFKQSGADKGYLYQSYSDIILESLGEIKLVATGVVINENGVDADFRVESSGNANMLFVDAGNNRVGVGTSSPAYPLVVSNSGAEGIEFIVGSTNFVQSYSRSTSSYVPLNIDALSITIQSMSNGVVINESGLDQDFRIESDTEANAFTVDGETGQVGVNSRRGFKFGNSTLQGNAGSSGGGYPVIGYNIRFLESNAEYGTLQTDTSWRMDIGTNNRLQVHSRSATVAVATAATYTAGPYVAINGTTWTDSSDARLKENVNTITGAIDKVKAMRPVNYTWIHDGESASNQVGFIAQEMALVVPEVVDIPEDDEVHQGIQYGKLVPVLTAALQEAITKIETLEARITALENA